jgi:hypothetical protein
LIFKDLKIWLWINFFENRMNFNLEINNFTLLLRTPLWTYWAIDYSLLGWASLGESYLGLFSFIIISLRLQLYIFPLKWNEQIFKKPPEWSHRNSFDSWALFSSPMNFLSIRSLSDAFSPPLLLCFDATLIISIFLQ